MHFFDNHGIIVSEKKGGAAMINPEITGKFIAQCRKEKQMTQKQLGEQLGVTDRAVSKWETGVSLR